MSTDPRCECEKVIGELNGKPVHVRHDMPKSLTTHYPLPPLGSESIPLYRGRFSRNSETYCGLVKLGLQPIPRLWVRGRRNENMSVADLHAWFTAEEVIGWVDRHEVSLPPSAAVPGPPRTDRYNAKKLPGVTDTGPFLPAPITINTGDRVDEVTFFLVNGWYALDGDNTCCGGHYQAGRLETTLGDWVLRLEPRGDVASSSVQQHMRSTGDHCVTHVGRLRRSDGGDFLADDTLPILEMLDDLLSFAVGRVVSTVLPVGSKRGQAIWAHWSGMRAVDLPLKAASWLAEAKTVQQIEELLSCGYRTSQDPLRWSVFKNALSYYLTANFNAPETMSTLLPVSGLQVLAYGHFVKTLPATDPAHVSGSAWENMPTQTILRDLLTLTKVDLGIPGYLANLTKIHNRAAAVAAANKPPQTLTDPLGSIVKMRNSVAHPNEKVLARWTRFDWTEAGIYTMHLFEVAMLWWLGYQGVYSQRTDRSKTASVPWHQPPQSP